MAEDTTETTTPEQEPPTPPVPDPLESARILLSNPKLAAHTRRVVEGLLVRAAEGAPTAEGTAAVTPAAVARQLLTEAGFELEADADPVEEIKGTLSDAGEMTDLLEAVVGLLQGQLDPQQFLVEPKHPAEGILRAIAQLVVFHNMHTAVATDAAPAPVEEHATGINGTAVDAEPANGANGVVHVPVLNPLGLSVGQTVECPWCHGQRYVAKRPCPLCVGPTGQSVGFITITA